jgi:protease-4
MSGELPVKAFLVRLFAVIGVLTTLTVLTTGFGIWYWVERPDPAPTPPEAMVLHLDFATPIVEQTQGLNLSLSALLDDKSAVSLLSVVRAIDRAKDDPRVKGLTANFGALQPDLAQAQEIRAALARFRASGKFTMAYAANYGGMGGGNRAYYLASAFQDIWLQPIGLVGLTGLGIEAPFGKKVLDTWGVTPDFVQREEYKSLMENATREAFSPPVRANMQSLLDSLATQEVDGIAEGRQAPRDKIAALMAKGPFTSEEALAEGLITRIGYWDELDDAVNEKAGKDAVQVDPTTYLAYALPKGQTEAKPKATVALITAEGLISDDPSGSPMRFTDEDIIDTDKTVAAFQDATDDEDVKAILFRVNSPGGSPSASESIRRALIKAKEAGKPVFVSMGEMAASGGYWIAMDADRIVAEPGTLTGSIGVVGGKFAIKGLSDKLGVTWDHLETAPNAGLWSLASPFTPEQRARIEALIDDTYAAFTKNVANARHLPPGKIVEVAKGRVFSGAQAKDVGLVDELGGVQTTIQALKTKLGLQPDDKIELVRFPEPETPTSMLFKLMKNLGLQSIAAQSALGDWQKLTTRLAPVLRASRLLTTQPVEARLPMMYEGLAQ